MSARKCPPAETVREHYAHGGTILDAALGDDLTTPEHLLHAPAVRPMQAAGNMLQEMARNTVEDLKQPAARAGFVTSLLTSALLARQLGMLPTIVIAVMVGVSVEHLYGMAEEIHAKLTADATSEV